MDWTASRLFWGLIVILIGVMIVVQVVFKIHFPIWRLLFGAVLIFWGIRVLSGKAWDRKGNSSEGVFSEGVYEAKNLDVRKFEYVFSSQTVDLRHVAFPPESQIQVEAVFASVTVLLPPDVRLEVDQEAVFASIDSRGVRTAVSPDAPKVRLKAEAVFANIEIRQ